MPSGDHAVEVGSLRLPDPAMTAQEFARASAGIEPDLVPVSQPPPNDMPPLRLVMLDVLADGPETIYSIRNCGEMVPDGLALVGEAHLLDALRSLMDEDLIEIEAEYVVSDGRIVARRVVGEPGVADEDLRRYWFCMTAL